MSGQKKRSARPAVAKQQRKRLSPQLRRAQILDAAAQLVLEQGYLPLPIERLARTAGSSKALIYTYFPTQYDLFNTLLERELASLMTAGLNTASEVGDLQQAAVLCGMLYYEHVARSGPLLQILTADLYMSGHENERLVGECNALRQRLARLVHTTLKLPLREAHAAVEMMIAIPLESASLVFAGETPPEVGRQMCHTLLLSSLEALRSPENLRAAGGHESS
jgi:AcrR family transcriptional regulator